MPADSRDSTLETILSQSDERYRLRVRVINENAWQNLFARNMFIRETNGEALEDFKEHVVERTAQLSIDWGDGTSEDHLVATNVERSGFFFAPDQIGKRMKEWGAEEFARRTMGFVHEKALESRSWLKLHEVAGLTGLNEVYAQVCAGELDANQGLIVRL